MSQRRSAAWLVVAVVVAGLLSGCALALPGGEAEVNILSPHHNSAVHSSTSVETVEEEEAPTGWAIILAVLISVGILFVFGAIEVVDHPY